MAVPALTPDQAREYLAALGITLPEVVLELLVAQVNSIDPCLEAAGYPDATVSLIKLYLLGLLGLTSSSRVVTSQRAPSGASQSFQYGTLSERYRGLYDSLLLLDTSGCTAAMIPPEPGAARAGLWVGSAGCGCE